MAMLGQESLDRMAKATCVVRPCFEEERGECSIEGSIIRIAVSQRKKTTVTNVKKQVEKEMNKSGQVKEDVYITTEIKARSGDICDHTKSGDGEETGSKLN